jgi:DNA/RNA-binding domain of Phe-tRNA-synthetase-like protein
MIRRLAILAVVSLACAVPATAEEIGVGVGPVGVTVGSGPDRVREREVVREREPRHEKEVIIKKERDPNVVVEKKTIIKDRD